MSDALRLAFGTLTALRVPAPRVVDRRVGASAMAWAPFVGAVLGGIAALVGVAGDALGLSSLVCAVLGIGTLAVLTRAIHLDGLADTADGLGSARRDADALAVMSRSDIGPFGVVTLVLVLFVQVAALSAAWSVEHGPATLIAAAVISRAALPLVCRRGVPAAKTSGLGAVVAGTVRPAPLATSLAIATAVALMLGFAADEGAGLLRAATAAAAGLLAAALLARHCTRRFGGTTGDVMGAAVEAAFALALLVLATGT